MEERIFGRLWLKSYPIRYAGAAFDARMSIVRLDDGKLWVHSPAPIEAKLLVQVAGLGPVAYLIAPGNFHYFNVAAWQAEFASARAYICPGVEKKRPDLHYDSMLGDDSPPAWQQEMEQAVVRGSRFMSEVAFFHRKTKTLILVDSIENFGDNTPNVNWVLRFYWALLGGWNQAKLAPEYRVAWKDRAAARASFERILSWDFDRIVMAHGDVIESNAKAMARQAWSALLSQA